MRRFTALLVLFMFFSILLSACAQETAEDGVSNQEVFGSESEITNENSSQSDASGDVSDAPAMSDKFPIESRPDSAIEEKSISIVVLGDSIARGYGLADVESQRFSSVLNKKLSSVYTDISMSNYGVDGQTGAELLEWLATTPPSELSDCDCVIISIGGNNILRSLSSLASMLDELKDTDPDVFKDYFLYLFAKDEETKQKYEYSCGAINEIFKKVNAAFDSDDFKKLIDKAGDDLEQEIPKIVSEIRKHNADADIYIQTVYNPYKNLKITLSGIEETLDMSHYGDVAVSKLNAPIYALANENGYTVVPVYEGFKSSKNTLINAGFDISNTKFSIDPHPNAMGHSYIAEIYYSMIKYKNLTEGQND